jgi:hypothetical protein
VLVRAPALAAAVTWLDTRAAQALLGPSRSVELERRVEFLSESRAGVVDAADAGYRVSSQLGSGSLTIAPGLGLTGAARVSTVVLGCGHLHVGYPQSATSAAGS